MSVTASIIIATATITGLGVEGYRAALRYLAL